MVSILRDNPPGAFQRYAVKLAMPALAVPPVNMILGVSYWYSVGLVLGNVLFIFWSFRARRRWGDRLDFSEDTLTVWRGDERRHTIEAGTLSSKLVKTDSVALSWKDGEKWRVLIVGSEGFSPDRWQALTRAVSGFGV